MTNTGSHKEILNTKNLSELIANVQEQINQEKDLSPALRASLELLILVVGMMAERLGINSKNSSTPPSADPNREKKPREKTGRKAGGQNGHTGKTLVQVEKPDVVKKIPLDRGTLPAGNYRDGGYISRQVFDIDISTVVTEYRAQVLINERGKRFVAPFPGRSCRTCSVRGRRQGQLRLYVDPTADSLQSCRGSLSRPDASPRQRRVDIQFQSRCL
jgi:hypothetical protein